ncbi:N-acetylmuramate alpha-1-phosphate uridylyltransferase MurU [Thiolapillus sp.]
MTFPRTAMIFAAGRGERLRPLTDHVPKPLLPVGGKPLIVWHLEKLAAAGFRKVVINHAHLGQQFEPALGDGSRWGLRIHYSAEDEGRALETGGGICKALPLLGKDPFLFVSGDVFSDVDYAVLELAEGDLAQLLLVDNPPHHPQGDFFLHQGRVHMRGKPRLTFSGIGICDPRLFRGCRCVSFRLAPLLRYAMTKGLVGGSLHEGYWLDVGTPERYKQLQEALSDNGTGNHT